MVSITGFNIYKVKSNYNILIHVISIMFERENKAAVKLYSGKWVYRKAFFFVTLYTLILYYKLLYTLIKGDFEIY